MKPLSREKMEELRKTNAVKSMFYTRYLVVRYTVTFFFFLNLYWALSLYLAENLVLMIWPLALLALAGLAMWEQFKMFTIDQKEAIQTKRLFQTTLISNGLALVLVALKQQAQLFPIFNHSGRAAMILGGLLVIGMAISVAILRRLVVIDNRQDRQYGRINRYLLSQKS